MTINFRWLKSDPIIEKEEMEREIFWLSDVCKLKTGIRVGCYNIYPQSVIMIYWTAKRWRLGVSRFPMAAECLWFFCFVSFQVFVSMTDVRDAGARFRRIKKKETVRYILVDVDIQMGAGGNPLSCSGATEHHEYHSCLSKCLFCASRFNENKTVLKSLHSNFRFELIHPNQMEGHEATRSSAADNSKALKAVKFRKYSGRNGL